MGAQPQPFDTGREQATWRRVLSRRRVLVAAVAGLALLIGVAGLAVSGGADNGGAQTSQKGEPTSTTALTPKEAAFKFAACMRDHGIDDYPDPKIEADGGVLFEGVSELAESSKQLDAAQQACGPILGKGQQAGGGQRHEIAPAQPGWKRIVPGGDCQCADGSEYSFYARTANPKKVVFVLDGGGACWSAETCAPDKNGYQTTVEPPTGEGVFDFTNERNPFADYSFVFIPYCTGDLHIGNATTEYTPDLTVHHKGYVNGTAALDYLTSTFPDATDVVVIGSSAGSVTAPLYGGLASDRLPDAKITVIADSSGSYPDDPGLDDLTDKAWGARKAIPDWPENAAVTAGHWSAPGLFIQSGRHDPDIVFARHDHAYDKKQALRLALGGVAVDDLLALIDANEAQIEAAGVNLLSYTAPGDDHVALDNESLYTETVDGEALIDWVTRLVEGKPVDDVHCRDCRTG